MGHSQYYDVYLGQKFELEDAVPCPTPDAVSLAQANTAAQPRDDGAYGLFFGGFAAGAVVASAALIYIGQKSAKAARQVDEPLI